MVRTPRIAAPRTSTAVASQETMLSSIHCAALSVHSIELVPINQDRLNVAGVGGNGTFTSGPYQRLLQHAMFTMDGDRGTHTQRALAGSRRESRPWWSSTSPSGTGSSSSWRSVN